MHRIVTITLLILGLWLFGQPQSAFGVTKPTDRLPSIAGIKSSDSEHFDSKTVFQAIDGAAEVYLNYGFQSLEMRSYTMKQGSYTVQLYDLDQPLNAFGVYNIERPSQAKKLKIGTYALSQPPHQCILVKNRFYLKIGATSGALTHAVCELLLRKIDQALPGQSNSLKELAKITQQGRVADSLAYTKQGYLGVSSLVRSIHAEYKDGSLTYQGFVLIPEEGQSHRQLFESLRKEFHSTQTPDASVLEKKVPYTGWVVVRLTKAGVYGVAEAPNLNQAHRLLERFSALSLTHQ